MTVVLIHGMFCGAKCWKLVDELLRDQGFASQKIGLHPKGLSR